MPTSGIIDTGADITIMGGELFKKVAAAARLKKRDFKKPDRVPHTYDRKEFKLHGRMDLDIIFDSKVLRTPIYIKMDAHDQLLLSEGVCSQLGIVEYHQNVWPGRKLSDGGQDTPVVAARQVRVLKTTTVPAGRAVRLAVTVNEQLTHGPIDKQLKYGPLLLEESCDALGLTVHSSLIEPDMNGGAILTIQNDTGFTERISEGTVLGQVTDVLEVVPSDPDVGAVVGQISSDSNDETELPERKRMIAETFSHIDLPSEQKDLMHQLLSNYHDVFILSDGERGETDLIQMEIETGDARPIRQHPRRMPYSDREEVARQLKKMQEMSVIQPSKSPWSSPVVLVRKKDGSHRFCVDYRKLNSVTKADNYPLPRIDDLLDQLGKSNYFSTLDLASGFWQIKVHQNSQERTAFSTPHGLFEFQVMPFGLTNAPSVFQRLMQQVVQVLIQ